MRRRFPSPLIGPALGAAYFLAWLLLRPTAMPFWMLPAGLRFGLLLLIPTRHWPWLILGEWLADGVIAAHMLAPQNAAAFVLNDAPAILITAGTLWGLARLGLRPIMQTPEDVTRLLAAGLLACALVTGFDALALKLMHPELELHHVGGVLGANLLGAYIGVLMLAPVLILLLRQRPRRDAVLRLLLDGLVVMLPSLLLLLALMHSKSPLPQFARVLSLAPVLYFAFRHGWRGAALALFTVTGVIVAFADFTERVAASPESHLFLAVAGTGALMLGAAIDALRRSSERLAVQNARLEGANRRLDQLARQLSEAARRNLRVEEEQRRYVAAELHDELGQNLTAIQTRVKLAQQRLSGAGLGDVATSINDILAHMRTAVRRLLNNLRPTVLDEFGLARALEDGPIRDMLHAADIDYHFELHGDVRQLDEDTRTTIYRVTQEAATNAVRHAMAGELTLRIRVGPRGDAMLVLLDIRDDGIGLPNGEPKHRSGRGLQSMRDRVTALQGVFRIRKATCGTRLRILLRAPRGDLAR